MMEDEFVTREKKILSLLEQEIDEGEEMAAAVRRIAKRMLLGEKGYEPEAIQQDVVFDVTLGTELVKSSVDFLVSLDGRPAMVIKCAAGSLTSRERHVVAAARVVSELPVPVAIVMDPMSAVVLDAVTGKTLGEGFDAVPTKEQLGVLLSSPATEPLSAAKLEREKRVLLAFDAIRCCVPKGVDGGVALGGPRDEETKPDSRECESCG